MPKIFNTIPENEVVARVNGSQLIMTCTQFNEKFLRALPGIEAAKVHRIYHGVDLEKLRPESLVCWDLKPKKI